MSIAEASHTPEEHEEPARAPEWGVARRLGFRALFVYFLLYVLPFPVSRLPWIGEPVSSAVDSFWKEVATWTGHHVLGIEGEIFVGLTGSGDTTVDYIKLLLFAVAAVLFALLWSLVDRRRRGHPLLARWLVVGCSYYLGLTMADYGFAKAIPSQFPVPSLHRLLATFGDSSPMTLIWTFMGFSPVYTSFTGIAELLGGLLVVFRRTRTLGALVLAGVLANIVMINLCYDVPVKLYSSHLFAMACALLLLDARRLTAVFLTEGAAPAARRTPLFGRATWANVAGKVLGVALVGWSCFATCGRVWAGYTLFGAGRERPPLHGIFEVETFVRDGVELPARLDDSYRWRRLLIDRPLPLTFDGVERPGSVSLQRMNGSLVYRPVVLDVDAQTLSFPTSAAFADPPEPEAEPPDVLTYEEPEPGLLVLRGTWEGSEVEITTRERPLEDLELTGRGFHWINERPRSR
ncbi:MAG: hypothetical protein AAF682_07400 [Planctomycetota bacterium]